MKFIDEKDLPVEVREQALPKDEMKNCKILYDERVRTSGGFTDAIFLGAIMVVSFMWGMLAILLR